MWQEMVVDGITIHVEKKKIKNLYIRILPPDGRIQVKAPLFVSDADIAKFVQGKMLWISRNQDIVRKNAHAVVRQYISGEKHFLWGKEYELKVIATEKREEIILKDSYIYMYVHSKRTVQEREHMMDNWYRDKLAWAIPRTAEQCEKVVGKHAREWKIKNMKTRWGTCNIQKARIWLNLQLAQKDPRCLEYVIIHELAHLYEKGHNARFYSFMDSFYPNWREIKKLLNEQLEKS